MLIGCTFFFSRADNLHPAPRTSSEQGTESHILGCDISVIDYSDALLSSGFAGGGASRCLRCAWRFPREPSAHVHANCPLIQIVIICTYGVIM